MRVRTRILLFFAFSLLGMIAGLSLVSDVVLKRAFERVEHNVVERSHLRLHEALNEETLELQRMAGDWAPWDETYAFVRDRDTGFIARNLSAGAVANLNVHLMLFFDSRGELAFGATAWHDGEIETDLPEEAGDLPVTQPGLFSPDNKGKHTAHLLVGGIPYIVVTHPILTSEHEGPAAGTLIFGRRIDSAMASRFSRSTQAIISVNEEPPVEAHLYRRIEEPALDPSGNVIANLIAVIPREMHLEYHRTQNFLYIALLAAGILLGFGVVWMIERTVLKPITRHIDAILSIDQHHSRRLPVEGHGETADLARAINRMLDTIARGHRDHERAQEALAAEKEHLAITLRSIGDGVITTDTRGCVLMLNQVAEEMTGWSREEAVGRPLGDVLNLAREDGGEPRPSPVTEAMTSSSGTTTVRHSLLITRDGRTCHVGESASPIRNQQGEAIGVVIVFRDETETRKAENERIRANKLESIGVLAGGIAHDFNNILTAIMANLSLARMPGTPLEQAIHFIEEADFSLDQARALTQQLLTFSSGGAPVRRAVSLRDLLVDAVSFALRGSRVSPRFHIADPLPAVLADPGQMAQVINNLVINAVEAMPGGGTLYVSANAVASDPLLPAGADGTRFVRTEIRDTGTGISPDEIGSIFDPYFSTKQRGSGLGLATCYSIITKHGGSIHARSETGSGTSIIFFIPVTDQPVPDTSDAGPLLVKGTGRILLMDDEPRILQATSLMLEKAGYQVATAHEGREAIGHYREAMADGNRFDAVILDLTVSGGMSGLDALREILAIDPTARAIASSGYSNNPVMADYASYGFCAVLPKPYSSRELSRILNLCVTG